MNAKTVGFAVVWMLLAFAVAQPASGQDVLVVGADQHGNSLIDNTRMQLVNSGVIGGTVDTFNAYFGTPTLEQLLRYQTVLVWSFHDFDDPDALGDVIAAYVDHGGGVVVTLYCSNRTGSRFLGGDFDSQGLLPIFRENSTGVDAELGTFNIPSHPVAQGVNTVANSGTSGLWDGMVTGNGTQIAEWDNGWPLVVENTGNADGQVMFLNMPAFDSNVSVWSFDPSTDAARLMANAVTYVAAEPELTVTRHGPSIRTVPFDEAGETGDGAVLLDFSIAPVFGVFDIGLIELRAFGSGDGANHYDEIALYRDDGSGVFEGSAVDTLVDSAPAFPSEYGTWTAALNASIDGGTSARYYVVGILNGTARNGLTFGVTLDGLPVSNPPSYDAFGMPTSEATALVIETPLTVSSFSPLSAEANDEVPVEIVGTGFVSPVTLTIDDIEAGGTAVINDSGTVITGLTTPATTGRDLPIILTVDGEQLVLPETFTYESSSPASGDGGCASGHTVRPSSASLLVLALVLLGWSRRCLAQRPLVGPREVHAFPSLGGAVRGEGRG